MNSEFFSSTRKDFTLKIPLAAKNTCAASYHSTRTSHPSLAMRISCYFYPSTTLKGTLRIELEILQLYTEKEISGINSPQYFFSNSEKGWDVAIFTFICSLRSLPSCVLLLAMDLFYILSSSSQFLCI